MLIIGQDPFFPRSSPDHSPQPRIDFPYYEISGPDICSLICDAPFPSGSTSRSLVGILNQEGQVVTDRLFHFVFSFLKDPTGPFPPLMGVLMLIMDGLYLVIQPYWTIVHFYLWLESGMVQWDSSYKRLKFLCLNYNVSPTPHFQDSNVTQTANITNLSMASAIIMKR